MKCHLFVVAVLGSFALSAASLEAQSPSVIYTWDYGIGSFGGPNVEEWAPAFGAQSPTLSNATDGTLTVTEVALGGDFAISDGFNYAKESAARSNLSGRFDFGGLDLLGLDTIEVDISHNGTGSIGGQVFLQPDGGGGCCGFYTGGFSLNPGANTVSIDLNSMGMSANEFKYVRALGIQIFGHAEPSPVTYEISEIRAGGTPLTERVIADHSLGLQNAVVKFDNSGIAGSTGVDNQDGLSVLENSLRWVDLGNGPGGAVAWGNGNALAVDFLSRPLDLSNYQYAKVTMKATPGAGAVNELGVQFYAQYADRDAPNEFAFGGTHQTLAVDGMFHELLFPLSALGADGDLDLTQWIGINLDPHDGGNIDIRVQSVVLTSVPEPSSMAALCLGVVAWVARRRGTR